MLYVITLLNSTILSNYEHINIWSDGGPAHFKIAKTLYFFSTLETQYGKNVNTISLLVFMDILFVIPIQISEYLFI